jgi:integrase
MAGGDEMMIELVEEYLNYRRKLGSELRSQGRELEKFAHDMDRAGHKGPLTNKIMLEWSVGTGSGDPTYFARKLNCLRLFAEYRALFDDKTEIPPKRILGPAQIRHNPYIYDDLTLAEVAKSFDKLRSITSGQAGLMAATYKTITGLILCTGLRISEVFDILNDDIDLDEGIIKIFETKFNKSRLVPLHPTAVVALKSYVQMRDKCFPRRRSNVFFVGRTGTGITKNVFRSRYRKILLALGLKEKGERNYTIHNMRHTFVVKRLLEWHQNGEDTEAKIAALSVYLGHTKVTDTYWYFTAIPELMEIVGQRFEMLAPINIGGDDV